MRAKVIFLVCFGELMLIPGLSIARSSQDIPIHVQDNLIRLPAYINGQHVDAVLDSGTGGLLLDVKTARRLGLTSTNTTAEVEGGGRKKESVFSIDISTAQVGDLNLSGVKSYSLNLDSVAKSSGSAIEALLGYPVFENTVVSVNYPAKTVRFDSTGEAPACPNPIPIKLVENTPVVEVMMRPETGDKPVLLHLIVDLGTRHYAAMLGGSFLSSVDGKKMVARGQPEQIGTGVGGAIEGTAVTVAQINVGDHVYRNLKVGMTSNVKAFGLPSIDGSLGVPIWIAGTISFDYKHDQLCLPSQER